MRLKSIQPNEEENPEINMTPLLDVLFVLLILFILIAPLLRIDRIELVSPRSSSQNLQTANYKTQSALILEVTAENGLYVNEKKIEMEKLGSLIHSLHLPIETIPILIQDKKSSFGTFEDVKQTLESIGFKQLDIVLEK